PGVERETDRLGDREEREDDVRGEARQEEQVGDVMGLARRAPRDTARPACSRPAARGCRSSLSRGLGHFLWIRLSNASQLAWTALAIDAASLRPAISSCSWAPRNWNIVSADQSGKSVSPLSLTSCCQPLPSDAM